MSDLKFRKYFPLAKDDATHRVYGIATAEVVDADGEICDYEGAKEAYTRWSNEAAASTTAAGQEPSYGNIRYQHTTQPAGKVVEPPEFRDAEKAVAINTEPIDDSMWMKIKKGFLRAFSHGGSYAWRRCNVCKTDIPQTKDGEPGFECPNCNTQVVVRYKPILAEVSYVDNPNVKMAVMAFVKADGTRLLTEGGEPMQTDFAAMKAEFSEMIHKDIAAAFALAKSGGKRTKRVAGEDLPPSAFLIVGDPEKTETWHLPVEFSTEEKTKSHIRNALARFNQTEGATAADHKRLVALAEKHGIDVDESTKKAEKYAKIHSGLTKLVSDQYPALLKHVAQERPEAQLAKSLYSVGTMTGVLMDLAMIRADCEWESLYEGGNGDPRDGVLVSALNTLIADAVQIAKDILDEETQELTAKAETTTKGVLKMAETQSAGALAKAKSVAEHIAKLKKLATSHHAEMHEGLDKLHKVMGTGESAEANTADAGNEADRGQPKAIDPKTEGTPNTYDKASVDTMLQNLRKEMEADMQKAFSAGAESVIKAITGEEDKKDCPECDGKGKDEDGEKCAECDGSGKYTKKHRRATMQKATAGIGDRGGGIAAGGPSVRVMPVRKVDDQAGAAAASAAGGAKPAFTAEMMQKAQSGDRSALEAFKANTITYSDLPPQLTDALSKVG
jgi:hypothetical protein